MMRVCRAPGSAGCVRLDERGASSVETLGVVVVAVLLAVGAIVGVAAYPSHVATALCRFSAAIGYGDGSCASVPTSVASPKTDADYQPGVCMLSESSERYNAEVKIWFVTIGEGSGFIVQQFSDGTVRATLTDGASVGANGALGSKSFDTTKLGEGNKAGVDVSLGANLKFEYGSTWQFDDVDQWTDMKDDLDAYLIQQIQMQHDQYGGYAIYTSLFGEWLEPPKDPKYTFAKVGVEVALKANAGVRVGTGQVDSSGNPKFVDPKLGFNLKATAGGSVVVQTNTETGAKSYTYEVSGSGKLTGDLVLAHVTGEGKVSGAFTTTYDANGALTELAFKSSLEYGAGGSLGNNTFKAVSGSTGESQTDTVATTTKLAVTDENRALVEEWLANRSGVAGEVLSLPLSAMVPDKPSEDPFLQLMFDEAKTSQITYHNVKDSTEFGMAVKKGWEFGFNVTAEEATATKTDADFLGAPTQDGTRPMIDDALCN
ncbi:hypothetical protein ACTHAM_000236 [Cellulomonas soli]|uniref:hypothetical protein n=1 Tax=Cellulomonas soli TaxID=931535 RepID=UPI003F85AF8A